MVYDVCGTCEPDPLSMDTRVVLVCAFFLMFCGCFVLCWFLMQKYYKRFQTLSFAVKADNCSRVNSTIHSILVVPMLFIGILTTSWGEAKDPTSSVAFLQFVLCITTAYFLCDTLVMVMYRVPLWGVYLTHHILAVGPYINYLFVSPCGYGLFLLSCFMLVEFSNYSLNAQSWLEQNGQAGSRAYAVCFYITFFGWIACRLINPYLMIYYAHTAIYPSIPSDRKWCFIPSLACGYLIVVFCTSVFIFVLCAALKKRWAAPVEDEALTAADKGSIASADKPSAESKQQQQKHEGSTLHDSPMASMDGRIIGREAEEEETAPREEDEEGMASPTRTIVHEAEKKIEELVEEVRKRTNSKKSKNDDASVPLNGDE